MKIYSVYLKPDGGKTLESAKLVPEGFSWAAFIPGYNIVWSLTRHHWALFAIIIFLYLLGIPQGELKGQWFAAAALVKAASFYFLALWSNDLMGWSLERRGFHLAGVVSGNSEAEAQLRFFEEIADNNSGNFHA